MTATDTETDPAQAPREPPDGPRWWEPLVDFCVHSVLGTLIFVIIFAPAVGLNILIHWIESAGEGKLVSGWLVVAATVAEVVLVGADLSLYVAFLVKEVVKTVRKFFKD